LFFPIRATCSAHLMLLDLISLVILDEEFKLWSVFNLFSFHPSPVKIFSSAPYSQTPSVYVLPLMSETKFAPIKNHGQKYSFVYSNFYVFIHQMGKQNVMNWMVAGITRIQSVLNFVRTFDFLLLFSFATFSKDLLALFRLWLCPAFWWRYNIFYVFFVFACRPTSVRSPMWASIYWATKAQHLKTLDGNISMSWHTQNI
jgi:hypothetical protein